MTQKAANPYFDPNFRHIVEDHLSLLLTNNHFREVDITNNEAHRYEGDFYGLMGFLGIKADFWWVNLRLNGLKANFDFDGTITTIKLVKEIEIEKIKKQFAMNK